MLLRIDMSTVKTSPELDLDRAVENVGGNRFDLVLVAAQRAREIEFQRRLASKSNPDETWENTSTTAALQEVEEGLYTREDYLKSKIK